jgi:hypothetical protein
MLFSYSFCNEWSLVSLIADSEKNLQILIDTVVNYSKQENYKLQPAKSAVMSFNTNMEKVVDLCIAYINRCWEHLLGAHLVRRRMDPLQYLSILLMFLLPDSDGMWGATIFLLLPKKWG